MEYELKLTGSEKSLRALEASLEQSPVLLQMHTQYYDTPTQALARNRVMVRSRLENGLQVWALKAPNTLGRLEFETRAESLQEAVEKLCKLSGNPLLAANRELVPVCGAEFTRHAYTLGYRDSVLELAVDRGLLAGGGKTLPFQEVEVELKSGPTQCALAFAMALQEQFSLVPEAKSKHARALELVSGIFGSEE